MGKTRKLKRCTNKSSLPVPLYPRTLSLETGAATDALSSFGSEGLMILVNQLGSDCWIALVHINPRS